MKKKTGGAGATVRNRESLFKLDPGLDHSPLWCLFPPALTALSCIHSIAAAPTKRDLGITKPPVPRKDEKPVMGLKTDRNFVRDNAVDAITKAPPQTRTKGEAGTEETPHLLCGFVRA